MKISKEDAAIIQLCDAVDLFFRQRYISSITLAAAAEEVIGKLLKSRTKPGHAPKPTMEELETGLFELSKDILGIDNYPAYRRKIRNELKHHGDESNMEVLSAIFKRIAQMHISGAINNYKIMYNKLPDVVIIRDYCLKVGLS
jgi:hypothetical protein